MPKSYGNDYDGASRSQGMKGGSPSDIFPKDVKFMGAKSPCNGLGGPLGDDMQAIDRRNKEMEKRVKKQKKPPYYS